MPKRSSTPKLDLNQTAYAIVAKATGQAPSEPTMPSSPPKPEKNPAADLSEIIEKSVESLADSKPVNDPTEIEKPEWE